ncbi:MAG: hypothetical protein NVS3B21_25470 [Acidimicrobiales bacterium]
MTPSRNDEVTMACPVCATPFVASGRRRYCRDACRVAAHRRRHAVIQAVTALPAGRRRKDTTVYGCAGCGARSVGEQRCADCGTFMSRVGIGGLCTCCEEPLTVDELMGR